MSELAIQGLNRQEQKAFREMIKRFNDARESDHEGCKIWVDSFSDERRAEIYEKCSRYQRSRLSRIEGVGTGRIHPSLLWLSHKAVDCLITFPRDKQDRFIKEGIPTVIEEGGKMIQAHLDHGEMSPTQLDTAFEKKGSKYHLRSRQKQKEFLTYTLEMKEEGGVSKEGEGKRGFGKFDKKKKVFIPAPTRYMEGIGYTYEEVQAILKEMKKMGIK